MRLKEGSRPKTQPCVTYGTGGETPAMESEFRWIGGRHGNRGSVKTGPVSQKTIQTVLIGFGISEAASGSVRITLLGRKQKQRTEELGGSKGTGGMSIGNCFKKVDWR